MAAELHLVLGAGGARGLGHVAVLEALDELGLRPARVTGVSIGAIVGAAYAAGLTGREIGAHVQASFRDRARVIARLLEARIGRLTDVVRGFGNPVLMDGERLLDLFWPQAVPDRFEQLSLPFTAIATDYHLRRAVALSEGPLTPAVAASLAIPGLVRPVLVGGRVLIDGGAVDPLPYEAAMGPGRLVIAADASPAVADGEASRIPGPVEALVGASHILSRSIVERMLAQRPPDLLLRVGAEGAGGLDFFEASRILAAGAGARETFKREIERLLARSGQGPG